MRAQLLALSQRLDRLEAENSELKSANAELVKINQQHRWRMDPGEVCVWLVNLGGHQPELPESVDYL